MAPPEETEHLLLKRASTLEQAGDIDGTLSMLRKAPPAAEAASGPLLHWALLFNLATSLCHLGRCREAAEVLPKIRVLTAAFGHDLDRLRVLWLSGRIAAGLGREDQARAAFEEARPGFPVHDNGYGAELVTLELAALDLEAGRPREALALSAEIVHLLRSHDLGRELLAAIRLF